MLNRRRASLVAVVLIITCAALTGCKHGPAMVKSPNLYISSAESPYAAVPETLRSTDVEVVYATDRQQQITEGKFDGYCAKRSRAMYFGVANVHMGEKEATWEQLAKESCEKDREHEWPLAVTHISERGNFLAQPSMVEIDGHWVEQPEYLAGNVEATKKLHAALAEQLAKTPEKELFVFVHGYNNTFDSGSFRAAQIWHFTGRHGVPVLYSWPAGAKGLLRGYNRDRESGEFTNPHLKMFLRALASCPEVKKIHLIAHSRGTDVLSNALRELAIASVAAGRETRADLKLGQVVLAAPDLDIDVTLERLGADRVGFVPEQLTMYVSPTDNAIGLSSWLFGSARRLGRLMVGDLDDTAAKSLSQHPIMSVVDARVLTDKQGHGYFLSSPAVLSDFILVLRDGKRPGAANGRPLEGPEDGMWVLRDSYLKK